MSYIIEGLFLGSADDAYNTTKLKEKLGITHLLTVDCKPITLEAQSPFTYKYIHALDMHGEDLMVHLDESNRFISEGRQAGGVLVHCYAGVSRSASLVLAYLLHHLKISLEDAMALVKKQRPQIGPNSGFSEQLRLYDAMGGTLDPQNRDYKAYRLSLLAQRVQNGLEFLPEDSLTADPSTVRGISETLYKCRKCRRPLFRQSSITLHHIGAGEDAFYRPWLSAQVTDTPECTQSLFVEPMAWMRAQIVENEGKLSCPKCSAKVGSYHWSGERCPCGTWVTPAFHVSGPKVDECKPRVLPPAVISQRLNASPAPSGSGTVIVKT